MKTGISTASFFSKELTENTFDIIRKLKIDTCEVFLTTFREYREEFVRLLNERREGIEIYSVHSLNVQFEPELFNTVQRTREDSEYFFKQIAAAANILGARYYTFHGLTRLKKTPYTLDYSRIGKRVDELDEMLSSLGNGCRLAYENVHWTCFNSPEFILQLKKYSNVAVLTLNGQCNQKSAYTIIWEPWGKGFAMCMCAIMTPTVIYACPAGGFLIL